ncbi:MAG: glycosyltransferase family 9 protein [SAR324 cluster bacterium]|nr:glycosyltransferase family 9 protein [SAR324 cluster bacterium]
MSVDLMRKIDHLVGVPLCGGLSFCHKLWRLFVKEEKKDPQAILLIELSEMGSTILVDPAMKKLKKELNADLFFLIFETNKASLSLLNTIKSDHIFTIRENSFLNITTDVIKFLIWARQKKIDTVIDLELFSRLTSLLSILCGAVNRVGFYTFHNEGLYRGEFLTHKVAYNAHIHIAKNFIALANSLLSQNEEVPYSKIVIGDEEVRLDQLVFDQATQEPIQDKVREAFPQYLREQNKIVLINPNASEMIIQRRWMPEYYSKLIRTILDHYPEAIVLITGVSGEREEAEQLRKNVGNSRCCNFTGMLTLPELPILYSISHTMVTNDSGPGHFSSIVNLPTFVIFGPETPSLYGSLGNSKSIYSGMACSPCVSAYNHRKTPCKDNVCLQVITPEEVFQKVKPVLDSDDPIDLKKEL